MRVSQEHPLDGWDSRTSVRAARATRALGPDCGAGARRRLGLAAPPSERDREMQYKTYVIAAGKHLGR